MSQNEHIQIHALVIKPHIYKRTKWNKEKYYANYYLFPITIIYITHNIYFFYNNHKTVWPSKHKNNILFWFSISIWYIPCFIYIHDTSKIGNIYTKVFILTIMWNNHISRGGTPLSYY